MINTNKKPHYDEEVAQAFLHNEEIDNCIVYCLPTIYGYLAHHKWSFIVPTNYDDIVQDLSISLIQSIRTYNPNKNVKLLSWIYTNFRYACLAMNKNEKPYNDNNVQLDEDCILLYYEPEFDVDTDI